MADRQQLIEQSRHLADRTGAGLYVEIRKPLLREIADLLERDPATLEELEERLEQAAINHDFNVDKAEGIRLAIALLKDPEADPHG